MQQVMRAQDVREQNLKGGVLGTSDDSALVRECPLQALATRKDGLWCSH